MRREFIKQRTTLGAIASVAPTLLIAGTSAKNDTNTEGNGFTFLFPEDSITDGNRTRNK